MGCYVQQGWSRSYGHLWTIWGAAELGINVSCTCGEPSPSRQYLLWRSPGWKSQGAPTKANKDFRWLVTMQFPLPPALRDLSRDYRFVSIYNSAVCNVVHWLRMSLYVWLVASGFMGLWVRSYLVRSPPRFELIRSYCRSLRLTTLAFAAKSALQLTWSPIPSLLLV